MEPSSHQSPRLNSAAALRRAIESLLSKQAANGSWEGEVIWCPLLAAQFVLMCHITHNGGWGEHFQGCLTGQYVKHIESQVIHTAWAMIALLKAHAPQWEVSEHGAHFLADKQLESGDWPK